MRSLYWIGLTYIGMSAAIVVAATPQRDSAWHGDPLPQPIEFSGAVGWFQAMRPYCNPVEVETRHVWMPPPQTDQGNGYSAACYALAGKIDRAAEVIEQLPVAERWKAAGIVFNVGHPVADAGDDRSAGPMMELVVAYWPNHYMALYHAGASHFGLGNYDKASAMLLSFLQHYEYDDGWRSSAIGMLERIEEQ